MIPQKTLFILFILFFFPAASAKTICGVYITGVGCPHCAASDPIILKDYMKKYPNFVVLEYEIYQIKKNQDVFKSYIYSADAGQGVPQMLIGEEKEVGEKSSGGGPTTTWTESKLQGLNSAPCKLSNGSKKNFKDLDLNDLPGKPKIWRGNRILIKERGGKTSPELLRDLLFENISKTLKEASYEEVQPKEIALSGQKVHFDNAVKLEGWRLQWNNELVNNNAPTNITSNLIKDLNFSLIALGVTVSLVVLMVYYLIMK